MSNVTQPNTRPASRTYWSQSRRPLASLYFTVPLLLVYELGILICLGENAGHPRNGAEAWLRRLLECAGLPRYYFLLPLLTVGILLGWHHTTGGSRGAVAELPARRDGPGVPRARLLACSGSPPGCGPSS